MEKLQSYTVKLLAVGGDDWRLTGAIDFQYK